MWDTCIKSVFTLRIGNVPGTPPCNRKTQKIGKDPRTRISKGQRINISSQLLISTRAVRK